jgi:hypothetical protein
MSYYVKKRADEDIQYYMQRELRRGLYYAVKKNWIFKKKECAISLEYLGCSVEEFRLYIESKFKEGMTWDNWGAKDGEWQLDHIKPLSAFDLTEPEQLAIVCHYSNIQPLWVKENAKKGSKMPDGEQPKRQHIRKNRELFISK